MKKIALCAALLLGLASANAQVNLDGSKMSDNWSLGLKGGGVVPFQNSDYIKDARGVVGVELKKDFTPIFGLGVEGNFTVNTSAWGVHSPNVFDASNVGLFGTMNFSNWLGGYKGTPRCLEVEAVVGAGWLHSYYPGNNDENAWSTKAGLNFNFNLGESKAWTLSLKPAVVWNMDYDVRGGGIHSAQPAPKAYYSRFNADGAYFECMLGLTYHFKNSNGKHHFTIAQPCDLSEIETLNNRVNALRSQLEAAQADANRANQRANKLQQELTDCQNKKPQVVEVVKEQKNAVPETNVTFNQGSSVVSASQMPNVERVATYLKSHSKATCSIRGYASPEGSAEINERIANARAEAVKTILVNRYKIAASRIDAKGQGVGDVFEEPDWNRVSICTIENVK